MRLTCPRCRAQYQIAASAIPAGGREVECSACGHVWHEAGAAQAPAPLQGPAGGQTPSEAPYDPTARPALNQPLNESILSILREETARELQAREPAGPPATATGDHIPANEALPEPEAPAPDTAAPVPDPPGAEAAASPAPEVAEVAEPLPAADADDWARPAVPALPDAALLAATLTRPAPAPAAPDTHLLLRPDPAEQVERRPEPVKSPVAAPMPEPATPQPGPRRRAGYASGFGLALMLALGLLAVYALAPRVASDGQTGLFHDLRQDIDRGRLWLHERVFGS